MSRIEEKFLTGDKKGMSAIRRRFQAARGARASIKPGARAPGFKAQKWLEPAKRAIAHGLSPTAWAHFLCLTRSSGLRPRLYAVVRFADWSHVHSPLCCRSFATSPVHPV